MKKARDLTTQHASQRADWVEVGGMCRKLKIKEGLHAVDWPINVRTFEDAKTEPIFTPQKFDKD